MKPEPHALITPPSWTQRLDPGALFPGAGPLEIDVGCGKGRFLLARAAARPDVRFLGIDRLLVRLRRLGRKVDRAGLANVRLLRIEAHYALTYLLPPGSATTVYSFFPDPWPKRRHHKRRLYTPSFLDALHQVLRRDGRIHVATDHADYFEDIRGLFRADPRFAETEPLALEERERTDFELELAGPQSPIYRASFRMRASRPRGKPSHPV
ncbi:MAG: tRNA (guanosine(46)-N7)-methyltransferase TrmB [Lentisphaerae bacterium]|nr:tRNA (guanosine(46)-N7)-methyltransferase TrmB [Lentisphaerota bacterium]